MASAFNPPSRPIPIGRRLARRMRGLARSGRRQVLGLRNAAQGVVVVEFALIVPFLFALYVGTAEYCRAMMNSQALTRLARTVADLTAIGQYTDKGAVKTPMESSAINDIFAASKLVLIPFDSSTAKIRVSAIGIYMKGTARTVRVCSAAASNATARPVGVAPADLDIPASYNKTGLRLIVAEVDMPYKPLMGKAFAALTKIGGTGEYPLTAKFVWPVRGGEIVTVGAGTEVVLPGGVACPATST